MKGMGALIIFVLLAAVVVVLLEMRERKRQSKAKEDTEPETVQQNVRPEGCCGEHLVCEKETLLNSSPEVVYYDDEELDRLAGIEPEQMTDEQINMINEVFATMREEDVPGWCRSLQMRGIQLPQDIREQALLIVREQRGIK